MKRVFVLNENKFDVSACGEYGAITPLTLVSRPLSPSECREEIEHVLLDFNPDEDYIAMSGSVLMLTYMLVHLLLKFTSINILVFNSKSRKYICRKMSSK